ncbi:MAG TPA: YdeI/OmpD-associated family protein [Saprospiraceae bacterium]|nr:YdeI/OmpD-associated family protein [Saprospiraceae bacterium]HPN71931.1 YdeI/OmpD-associated family protein [Saprospiraceae bacterium]
MKEKAENQNLPNSFYPKSRSELRNWLVANHEKEESVWIICYKKGSGMPTISWSEMVDELLCFGWIDGKRNAIDHEKFKQFVCKRKPKSIWSKINKQKILDLGEAGLMTAAGYRVIDVAKANGSWNTLVEVDDMLIPDDLEVAFANLPGSKAFFLSLSNSVKKLILYWIVSAKMPETRNKRIADVAESASQQLKPTHLR